MIVLSYINRTDSSQGMDMCIMRLTPGHSPNMTIMRSILIKKVTNASSDILSCQTIMYTV